MTTSIDPTNTFGIRQALTKQINALFDSLRKSIYSLVSVDDAFGIRGNSGVLVSSVTVNVRFAFVSNPDKIKAFQEWLSNRVNAGVLKTDFEDEPWLSKYVESAYKQAVARSYVDVKGDDLLVPASFVEGTKKQFLESTFGAPQTVERIKLLYTRSFEQLKGVTSQMAGRMSSVLADGLANGKGPRQIALELTKETDLSKQRALRIARTEIIHAYAEGQLDTMQELGVESLDVMQEWLTAGDDRVCPRCAATLGKTFTIKEARGMIPLHPNCRCAWIPHVDVKSIVGGGRKAQKQLNKKIKEDTGKPPSPQAPAPGLFGHQPTAVARWMGANGWSFEDAKRVMADRSVPISDATLKIQLRAGLKGERGAPASLTPEQVDFLKQWRNSSTIDKSLITPPKPNPILPPPPKPILPPPKPNPILPPPVSPILPVGRSVTDEERQQLSRHTATSLVRWLGANGYSKTEALAISHDLGLNITESTLGVQLRAGLKGERGAPAELTEQEKSILVRYRGVSPQPKPKKDTIPPSKVKKPVALSIEGGSYSPPPDHVKPPVTKGQDPTQSRSFVYSGRVDSSDKYSVFGDSFRALTNTTEDLYSPDKIKEFGSVVSKFIAARIEEDGGYEALYVKYFGKENRDEPILKMAEEEKNPSRQKRLQDVWRSVLIERSASEGQRKAGSSLQSFQAWIRSEYVQKLLPHVRDVGHDMNSYDISSLGRETKSHVKEVAKVLPTSWQLPKNLTFVKTRRGYFDGWKKEIALSESSMSPQAVIFHELTHAAEYHRLRLGALCKRYRDARTEGHPMVEVRPGEFSRKDHFLDWYQAREYQSEVHTEVITMGVEEVLGGHLRNWSVGESLHQDDNETYEFCLGLLFGV